MYKPCMYDTDILQRTSSYIEESMFKDWGTCCANGLYKLIWTGNIFEVKSQVLS